MPSVTDVAKYILNRSGPMTAMKLQKLCYYAQAWSLVWDERPLFADRIEAWANGPVSPALYSLHRGKFNVSADDFAMGKPETLDDNAIATVDSVLKTYGDKTSQWLSDLTHAEHPWRDARVGMGAGERGNKEITHASMAEYYASL